MSEPFRKIQNTWPRLTEDVHARTENSAKKVKSEYRQEVVHGRNSRTQEKLRLESLSTRRETGVKR